MKAIIMAGGAGSRLRPLTCGRPKPIVPIMNKAVMGRIIELLKKNGITDIGVTLQFLPEKIEMKVVETEPAVKGNTTNNALKDAVLETGLKVRVPLFVEQGEMIIVSTKDGKYVSRA